MARRESGVDYAVDRNERPAIQLVVCRGRTQTPMRKTSLGRVPPLDTNDTALVSDATHRNHNVLAIRGGKGRAEYLTWNSPMEASFRLLERLDAHWTRATGSPPVESADSGAVESGVALARRKAGLVAKVRELHEGIYDMLAEVLGRDFEWPYVGTILDGDEPEPPPMRVQFE